jgi:hypothetical protein
MNVVQGELIAAGSTDETVLVLTDVDKNEKKSFYPKVISGTVKFGVNDVPASAVGYTSADVVPPFHCFNGELYFDAASTLDTFTLGVSAA